MSCSPTTGKSKIKSTPASGTVRLFSAPTSTGAPTPGAFNNYATIGLKLSRISYEQDED